jgi:D-alanyl-D-alanine carboxypeptidase/D-alanyl-D-alanine-endopeptidase (penicillin-binding protein 4)|nr:D-alanyl-D-alanine carboxypeptidase [Kofleriaceae bacterium]
MSGRRTVATMTALLVAGVASASPRVQTRAKESAHDSTHDGVHARVMYQPGAGAMRAPRDAVGRREEPLTAEEQTAHDLEKLIHDQLGTAVTGLYVVDAKTGEPLFAVNADDKLNPASNVKMISTATALELLGPEFHYPTRVLGPAPDDTGTVRGDVYLFGSWDPTLVAADLDAVAAQLEARGVRALVGDVVIGGDGVRDGVYHPSVAIGVAGGSAAGAPAVVTPPAGFDLVTPVVTAKTAGSRAKLTYKVDPVTDAAGHVRLQLTVDGTIARGATATYTLAPESARSQVAAHLLRAAMRAHGIAVTGDVAVAELPDFIAAAVGHGALPIELARHESAALGDIVSHVNKYSINWLADRVVISAAALHDRAPATIASGVDAMYGWLGRHAQVSRADAVLDTGSGLSYKTQVSPRELVQVVRGASGFAAGGFDATLAHAWTDSLSIGGRDGTLTYRFRAPEVRGHLVGKTGTLSTAIALSGLLEVDPARPLAFSIVTNTSTPLEKQAVRKSHEALIGVICTYLARTQHAAARSAPAAPEHAVVPGALEDADSGDDKP